MKLGEFRNLSDDIDILGTVDNLQVSVGDALLGRVIDAMECPADGRGEIETKLKYPLFENPPKPMERKPISKLLYTGIRSIDSSLAIGKGQRLGIFGGSGVGKTSLLSMIAKNNNADINVIGLIGDRSRENQDFINNLGQECLRHSVIIEANSEQLAILKVRSAYVCSAIAEYFRDNGKDVVLMIDSITRLAYAQSEIGETACKYGYASSVYEMLNQVMERTGTNEKGTISAFYSVLSEEGFEDSITNAVQGLTDGHIILSREKAQKGDYPAIKHIETCKS